MIELWHKKATNIIGKLGHWGFQKHVQLCCSFNRSKKYKLSKLIPVFESSEKKLAKDLPTDFHSKYMGYVTSLNGTIYPKDEMSKIFKLINS